MTVDKTIYDNRETAKKISFLAELQRRYEKAKAKGFKGDIREFRENLLKEKHKDILNRSELSTGGKSNGKYKMPEINLDSFDWDMWLRKNDPDYMTLEEEEKLSKRKVPNKLVAYKFGATSQGEEDFIGGHVDDWTNAINKGELDPSVNFMQYLDMILGKNKMNRGGIISAL